MAEHGLLRRDCFRGLRAVFHIELQTILSLSCTSSSSGGIIGNCGCDGRIVGVSDFSRDER